jgi:RimJ/RimL family protein N-acetyltransferase
MIALRLTTDQDWARLFAWRNDPLTRQASVKTDPVLLEDHLKWFAEVRAKTSVRLFVARDLMGPPFVGTARIDQINAFAVEVSLTVAPPARGQGYAAQIIRALVEETGVHFPKATVIKATVRTDNYASLCAFAEGGFTVRKVKGEFAELTHDRQ